jgi:uncharacterized protein with HEPN domain
MKPFCWIFFLRPANLQFSLKIMMRKNLLPMKSCNMQHAAMRLIQIIGEACRKISGESKNAHPQIPWTKIIGMRHRLVHEYFRVDAEIVWEVVSQDIPTLIPMIEPLVPPE